MRAVALSLAVALLSSCAHAQVRDRTYPHAWTQAVPPKPVPPVHLAGKAGPVYLNDLKGKWVWLFFGYGSCPDVCPTTLQYMAQAYGKLADPSRVQVVFVSVDPTRDTPAKLAELAGYFNPTFQGVTGEPNQLQVLAAAVGAAYRKDAVPRPGASYTISHSNAIFILDPEGRQVATYEPDADPVAMAKDFDKL